MKGKIKVGNVIRILASVLVLFLVIGFMERQQSSIAVHDIVFKVENVLENHFIDEQDIVRLMELEQENIKGAPLDRLNLKEIEGRIKTNRFVKDAELYSDIKGNLVVRATLRRPIARIVREEGHDAYIAEDGTIMPVSDKFTARVVLISGPYARQFVKLDNIYKHEDGHEVMEMLSTIRKDDFWRAQIAQLDFDSKGRIFLLPQVGSQTIEFGRAEKLNVKLRKLKIFYKEVLPQMGWNKYKRISLEYENQIVAE